MINTAIRDLFVNIAQICELHKTHSWKCVNVRVIEL